ncbi:MAG: hypothetical protein NZ839_02165, partial [Endomicrobia bacterium]|nr:hypothetical protein [Endomicrobiia bacterium]
MKNKVYPVIIFTCITFLFSLGFALYYIYNGGRSNNNQLSDGDVEVSYFSHPAGKPLYTTSNQTVVVVDSVTPATPEILFPSTGAKLYIKPIKFQWSKVEDETDVKYLVEISTEEKFSSIISSFCVSSTYFMWVPDLSDKYFWRVGCVDFVGNFSGYVYSWFLAHIGIWIQANVSYEIVEIPKVKINIPDGALPVNLQLYFTTAPVVNPISVDVKKLQQAIKDLSKTKVLIKESMIELVLKTADTGEDYTSYFNKEVELCFAYRDVNNDNLVDEYNRVFAQSLRVYTFKDTHWVECPSEVDLITKQVKTKVKHFSVFVLAGQSMPSSLENVFVYPNPYKTDYGINYVVFKNLTKDAKIRIYTLAGEL